MYSIKKIDLKIVESVYAHIVQCQMEDYYEKIKIIVKQLEPKIK